MKRLDRSAVPLAILAVLLSAACGGDDGPTGLDPNEFELVTFSGGGQEGLAGTILFEPLAVMVRARDTGAAEDGVLVNWEITQGNARPTRGSSATDRDGIASTRIQFGAVAGAVRAEARVLGLPSVSFDLRSLAAPVLLSVAPSTADPGDVVEVHVRDLPDGFSADVLFDGVSAEIVERTGGDPATLRAVVPPPAGVCEGTVDLVDVRVRVGQVTTAPVTVSVTVPVERFQVGQVLIVEQAAEAQCALLPADGGGAEYLLVVLSSEFEEAGNLNVDLGGSSIAVASSASRYSGKGRDFHTGLRLFERDIAVRGVPMHSVAPGDAQLFAQPDVGSRRDFWVLNNTDNLQFNRLGEDDFDRIRATLRFKGVHTLLYVDDAAPSGGLTQVDIDFLGELFDRRLYDVDVDFFGTPTDVDGNDRVVVLLSPVVNGLTPRGADGIIVGFFFALDLFSADINPSTCPPCRFSNESELFYGLVPDPQALHSDTVSLAFVRRVMPGVMVHEMQHMISFRYKFFEHATDDELLWLSEGLAHMAEELAGDEVDAAGQAQVADDLYIPNFGRALRYLLGPDTVSLTAMGGQGTLAERGAAWLFLRWIGDQYGDFIFRGLTQSPDRGIENIERQTGETFFRLFGDWSVALWADDQPIPGLAQRHQVPKWQLREIVRVEPQGGGDPVYALQPLRRTFTELRSGSISRTIRKSSALYVELSAAGDATDLQLELEPGTGAGVAILRSQ